MILVRIISGNSRGTRLKTGDSEKVRPTKDVVKEAVFNMIMDFPQNSKCLDLYAGFGNLGLEAASRGAERVTFVEIDHKNCDIIKENIKITHTENVCEVVCNKARSFLNYTNQKYDLVFIDPPYDSNEYDKALKKLTAKNCLINPAIIIVEFYTRAKPDIDLEKFIVLREKEYGKTGILLLEYQG